MASKKKNSSRKNVSLAVKAASEQGRKMAGSDKVRFIAGVILFLAAVYMAIAFISYFVTGMYDQSLIEGGGKATRAMSNWTGSLGASLAYFFINDCFGVASVFFPVFLVIASLKLMKVGKVRLWKWFANFAFLTIWLSIALQFFIPDNLLNDFFFLPGGKHGRFVCDKLIMNIGKLGTLIVLLVAAIIYFVYLSDETVRKIRSIIGNMHLRRQKSKQTENQEIHATTDVLQQDIPQEVLIREKISPNDDVNVNDQYEEVPLSGIENSTEIDEPEKNENSSSSTLEDPYDPRKDLEYYKFPPFSLLKHYDNNEVSVSEAEKRANEDKIRSTLKTFGVDTSNISATVGPTVTLYEVTPAKGVRISKIRGLEDDIARSIGALGIRIIAPIPGKTTVGIEVPNENPQIVSMESVLVSDAFRNFKAELPVVIGKTITNEPFMFDLAKLPHLLVAGATGQGKSVGLNAIITSLLYRKHPAELKLVLIDPKKVEFSLYSPLEYHFLAKVPDNNDEVVITDVDRVVYALNSLCKEMDTRYALLKSARVRNIKEYNKRFCERKLNPNNGHRYLPYIVVIVDEFADLIMTAGKNVETPIIRISQLARAVGIHMIIATQRPTTNIITGTIKANFPGRIAFKVMQAVDSRTILDRTGANRLVGRGDMLYLNGGEPVRVQCAFVDTPEVEDITNFISQQQGYTSPFELPEIPMPEGSQMGDSFTSDDPIHLDPLFNEAAKAIVESGTGSTSAIQRRSSIGYNRAGRIMDQLEKVGIVGPQSGAKPREVLCSSQMEVDEKVANFINTK